jgi:RNA polymerase sigma-70 factor (ECF subfamily)
MSLSWQPVKYGKCGQIEPTSDEDRSEPQPSVLILGVMDRTLVERAARGDMDAFEDLVRLSSTRLYGIAQRIVRDHHLAEDVVQQAWVTVWDELPNLRDPDRFDAWTYRLVVRAAVAAARRERRGGTIVQLLPDDADTSRAPDDYRAIADRDQLDRAFKGLKPDMRAVLVLQHYAGLTLVEVADVLGIPVGTAASRTHYATRAMRASIDADERATEARERTA